MDFNLSPTTQAQELVFGMRKQKYTILLYFLPTSYGFTNFNLEAFQYAIWFMFDFQYHNKEIIKKTNTTFRRKICYK